MQLNNPLGDGQTEASAALLFRNGAIYLMKFLKNTPPFSVRDSRSRVRNSNCEGTVHLGDGNANLSGVRELYGVTNQIEKHLGNATFIALTDGEIVRHFNFEREVLGGC